MGTSTKANIENTAETRARWLGSSIECRSIRYPAYNITQISAEVRRASHTHQTPQIIRPQMDPSVMPIVRNTNATSVTETAIAS
jgi:hypothetical protein